VTSDKHTAKATVIQKRQKSTFYTVKKSQNSIQWAADSSC